MNDVDISEMLKEPFDAKAIRWRVGATTKDNSKGIALAYIDARDVMNRFDQVVGSLWQCRYPGEGLCEIGLKIDGEWIWRANGAGETAVEGEKGQYSDAFKRAAVLWGVGRYLYYLPNSWVPLKAQGRSHVIVNPPSLPSWALPKPAAKVKVKTSPEYKPEKLNDSPEQMPEYPEEKFTKNFGSWKKLISSGKYSAKDIIAKCSADYTLIDVQAERIKSIGAAKKASSGGENMASEAAYSIEETHGV